MLLFCSISCVHTSLAQKKYLDEVFEIIEQHSVKRDSIDFKKIKERAYTKLSNVKSINDCYPIVRSILVELNDHHSFFMEKKQVDEWQSTSKTKSIAEPPSFKGKLLNQNIGYVHMEGFSSGDSISILQYSNDLQNLIKSIDNETIRGWILDLRENTGGNCWPMLTGLGPLLGSGICGYFIDNRKNRFAWYYEDGKAGINAVKISSVSITPYKLYKENNPIAVLTGPQTASSGEVVVTSFRGKGNVRSFGENTAGLSTGNANYTLSDGSMIFLTTSVYADRDGNYYGGKIAPDSLVNFSYAELDTEKDQVMKRAIEWITKDK